MGGTLPAWANTEGSSVAIGEKIAKDAADNCRESESRPGIFPNVSIRCLAEVFCCLSGALLPVLNCLGNFSCVHEAIILGPKNPPTGLEPYLGSKPFDGGSAGVLACEF